MRALCLVALLSLSAAAAREPFEYVPCKYGLFRCGELRNPNRRGPTPGTRRPTPLCGAALRGTIDGLQNLSMLIGKVMTDQGRIADMLDDLGDAYNAYPDKSRELHSLAAAVRTRLLNDFVRPYAAQVGAALACFNDERTRDGPNCRTVPFECFNREEIEAKISGMSSLLTEFHGHLGYRRPDLVAGLPACGQEIKAPCTDHMDGALRQIIDRQRKLVELVDPMLAQGG